jgi:RNA polymerase sigma-32 factor
MVNKKKKHKQPILKSPLEKSGPQQTTEPTVEIVPQLEELGTNYPLPVPTTERNLQVYTGDITDPLSLYIREINRYDLLSIEQERALTHALKESGDVEIAKQLVMANLRLVVKIAMEYRNAYSNVMDLIQEGNIGLMKAVSKYDPERGAKLSYYASWWIKSYILKFILDNFRLIKIGTTNEQKKLFYNLMKEKERLKNLGIDPTQEQISKQLGVSEKAVGLMEQRLGPGGGEVSLDQPLGDSSGSGTVEDLLSHPTKLEDDVEREQGLDILNAHMGKFLLTLKDRDREIFKNRLLSDVPDSLQKIANQYGVSRERIRQIEERLVKRLTVYMSEFIR